MASSSGDGMVSKDSTYTQQARIPPPHYLKPQTSSMFSIRMNAPLSYVQFTLTSNPKMSDSAKSTSHEKLGKRPILMGKKLITTI